MTDPSPSPEAPPLDSAWLAGWRRDIDGAVAKLLAGFEKRFGYPPGEDSNAVRDPSPEDLAAADRLSENPLVPPALKYFYRHIGHVDLADVGNGYFIHPAAGVLEYLPDSRPGAFFASDGGGIHYVIAADGTVHRSSAASLEADFAVIAADLQEFLDRLRNCLIGFLETGEPGDL